MLAQEKESSLEEKIACEGIAIGCLILGRETGGEHIINTDEEYQELMQSRSPHSNCGDYNLPVIDFNQYTLIGYIYSIGGCKAPEISHEIRKQDNQYTIHITVIQHGMCFILNSIKMWCLIPKVQESSAIIFNIETTTNTN